MIRVLNKFLFGIRYFFKSLIEQTKVVLFFYVPYKWYKIDLLFSWYYWKKTPYKHNLSMMKDQGLDKTFLFGETPVTALKDIMTRAQILPDDVVFDLGCGWGKTTFFLATTANARRVVGIDCSEHFISTAETIRSRLDIEHIIFIRGDFFEIDYSDADVVYFYGSCATKEQVVKLCSLWRDDLKPGAMVITTSYSLREYSDDFDVVDTVDLDFLWGLCTVFFHVKKQLQ
ncbi:MAG: hypothetical protein CMK59_14020 [Proteobacteria bacterium]|nr:hypothetical protein [Pseudomonadota bacterium]|tara:strand:+ start:139 stop:825 length:687 start_codon:yes stop_codon:yes gene_type:complete